MVGDNSFNRNAILFVDDEDKALKYFNRAFTTEFKIITANSVDQAIDILATQHSEIAILVTDQRMPEKTGVELLKHTREFYPEIIRILTTAYSNLESAIDAVNSGEIFRYITKPWDIRNLRGELISALSYYEIKHERNLLLKEKLSIWQRLTSTNRARDMIIMAGSFPHLRHSMNAIHAFLTQFPHIEIESPNTGIKHFDPWQAMQNEIQRGIDRAQNVILNTWSENSSHNFLDPININELLGDKITETSTLSPSVKLEAKLENKLDVIYGNQPQLKCLFEIMLQHSRSLCQENGSIEINTSLTKTIKPNQKKNNGVNIEFLVSVQQPTKHHMTTDLMTAFFVVYHHGGSIKYKTNDSNTQIIIHLPETAESSELAALPTQFLEEIFDAYENKDGFS
ncbi:MAG: response regulator [Gammaproteobacteria bacterium]|nr:response regulator [Gammaproteobacteria bacterium]